MTQRSSILFILSTILFKTAFAYEFQNLKLKNSTPNHQVNNTNNGLRGSRQAGFQAQNSQNNNLLLEYVKAIIGSNIDRIGEAQVRPILNGQFGGKIVNFSGFTWNKPQGNIQVSANREISPDLYSDKFIVHDTLSVYVDANTYLAQLRDSDSIEISDDNLSSFLGIGFKRVYHYYHLEKSYQSGLQSDYSKLFHNFTRFQASEAINLSDYDILKRQDEFTFNAGGALTTPPRAGLSLSASAFVDIAFKNEIILQALGQDDKKEESEFLRVSSKKDWNISSQAQLSLQLDFFNLLKIFLIQGELEYEYAKSNKSSFSFFRDDKKLIETSRQYRHEFQRILKGEDHKTDLWKKNIVQVERSQSKMLSSKYSVLLFGSIKKKKTQKISIVEDGVDTTFFKHYSESTRFVRNILSTILNSVIKKILNFDIGTSKYTQLTSKVRIEYRSQSDINNEQVNSDEEFSLSLTKKFMVNKTHRRRDKRRRKTAVKLIKRWSNLDSSISQMIKKREIIAPMNFESKVEVELNGIRFFHNLDEQTIFKNLVKVCRSKRGNKWLNSTKRKRMLRRVQIGRSLCVKKLGNTYLSYISVFKKTGLRDLKKLRRFITKYFTKARSLENIQDLFGDNNVFIYGNLQAKTAMGSSFNTYFKTGQFRGLGVIDSFIRKKGIVSPIR